LKKMKAKPRTKTHSQEQVNKFASLYKEIESTKPVASITLSVSSAQQTGSYQPPQRICKAYTYGTFKGSNSKPSLALTIR
jgi:fatty acid-binding protein DegV